MLDINVHETWNDNEKCRTYTNNGFYCVVINIKIKTYFTRILLWILWIELEFISLLVFSNYRFVSTLGQTIFIIVYHYICVLSLQMCVSTRANNISNYKLGEMVVINNACVLTLLLDYTSVNPCKSYKIHFCTIVDLFCKNGFHREKMHQRRSLRCERSIWAKESSQIVTFVEDLSKWHQYKVTLLHTEIRLYHICSIIDYLSYVKIRGGDIQIINNCSYY